MAGEAPFLIADGLTRAYGATVALDRVDLAAPRGNVLAVLGPNGCGKTTTVRIFATLLRPDSGRALVAGHDVVTAAAAVRAMIGLAGQYAAVDPFLTGRENLELVTELRHLPRVSTAATTWMLSWNGWGWTGPPGGSYAPTRAGCAVGLTWPLR
jgi:ABC-type multidrug transport system ATPase subunit